MDDNSRTGLLVKVYPPRWTDDTLDHLSAWALKVYAAAPKFGTWLLDVAEAEQLRRLKVVSGETIEVTPVVLPFLEWNNAELADAMTATMALSYCVRHHEAGAFVDLLVQTVNAAVSARLRRAQR